MRNAHAYLASFGTAGSQDAGAALLFVLATALVTFRGWPQVGAGASLASVTVSPPAGPGGSPAARRLAAVLARDSGAGVVGPAVAIIARVGAGDGRSRGNRGGSA